MSAASKVLRSANSPRTAPDALEMEVAQAIYDLQVSVNDLKSDLAPLAISSVKEVEVKGGRKALAIFVPIPQLKAFHKIQGRLTRELEKKFSDRHVVFLGQRRMQRKPGRNSRLKQPRPRSRTLKEVHERTLEDLVYPTEITGKRTRQSTDGNKTIKVFLDPKEATAMEYKLDSFSAIYNKLTGKTVTFQFAQDQ